MRNSMTLVLNEAQTYSDILIHSQLRVENTPIKVVNPNIHSKKLKYNYTFMGFQNKTFLVTHHLQVREPKISTSRSQPISKR